MPTFPRDRFDEIPKNSRRAGAHRGRTPKRRAWIVLAACAVAALLLVGGGLIWTNAVTSNSALTPDEMQPSTVAATPQPTATNDPGAAAQGGQQASAAPTVSAAPTETSTPSSTPTPTPTADRDSRVTVLNGTTRNGIAAAASSDLEDLGYTVPTTTNADSSDVTVSTVYYVDESEEETALDIASELGIDDVEQSSAFSGDGDLVVVLGTDYSS